MGKSEKSVEPHVKTLLRSCRNCDYFEDYTKNHNTLVGFCRRYPPKPFVGNMSAFEYAELFKSNNFPWVHKDCWCGEYVKRGSNK
jgi:hypothetical protein